MATNATLEQTIVTLKARIADLEELPPVTPPATTNPPVILNERFKDGVDWDRYFSDRLRRRAGGAPDRRFQKTPDALKFI